MNLNFQLTSFLIKQMKWWHIKHVYTQEEKRPLEDTGEGGHREVTEQGLRRIQTC